MLQITFTGSVYQPEDEVIPGNASSPTPVKFHLEPPLAPDLARLKSIVYAVTGLANPSDWTPGMQVAVLKAFETGRDAFDHTVRKVEGLYVPAVAALRCGAITPNLIPKRIDPVLGEVDDEQALIPIVNGVMFSRVCVLPDLTPLSLVVALKLVELSEKKLDPRFFAQGSGIGGTAISGPQATTAAGASRTSGGRATAGSRRKKGDVLQRGTFRSKKPASSPGV